MTTLDSSKEIQKNNSEVNETHEDFRMFGLITFLIADGMTFAGFFAAYLTSVSYTHLTLPTICSV